MRRGKGRFGGPLKLGLVIGMVAVAFDKGVVPMPDGVPGLGGGPPTAAAAEPGKPTAGFNSEQVGNANTIVAVGRDMGVPKQGQVVAIATAIQESALVNVDYGDRDSLGLFQQRPSQGWGTEAQVTDPVYSATQFYKGLQAVPGWESMPVTVAAQTVQRSAYPDAYAEHEDEARALVDAA